MMRGTIEAERDAGVMTDEPHGLRGIGDIHADLLAAKQAEERGEGGDERRQPAGGHAGRDRHHVLLGDAELDVAVGIGLGETC